MSSKSNTCFSLVGQSFTILIVTGLFFAASPSAIGAEQVKLGQMAGKWSGKGWAVRKKGAPKERVRCRLKAKYSKTAKKLSVSGKCAATSGTYTLLGHIAEYSGSKKLTGRWVNPKGVGAAKVRGRRNGNRLTFVSARQKAKGKAAYKTVWDIRSSGFTLSTGHTTGAHNALGQIVFQR